MVLAIPFKYIPETATQVSELSGKIIIDATNPYPQRDGQVAEDVLANPDITASQFTTQQFPEAPVVKVLNTVYYINLRDKAFASQGSWMARTIRGRRSSS